jgi:hypothetical protein
MRNVYPDYFQTINAYWCVTKIISAIIYIKNLRIESSKYEGSICNVVHDSICKSEGSSIKEYLKKALPRNIILFLICCIGSPLATLLYRIIQMWMFIIRLPLNKLKYYFYTDNKNEQMWIIWMPLFAIGNHVFQITVSQWVFLLFFSRIYEINMKIM